MRSSNINRNINIAKRLERLSNIQLSLPASAPRCKRDEKNMYMELVCECPNQLRLGLLQAAILLMSNAARNSKRYDHRSWPALAATPATGAPADPRTPPGSRTNWTFSEPAEPAEGTGSFFFLVLFLGLHPGGAMTRVMIKTR